MLLHDFRFSRSVVLMEHRYVLTECQFHVGDKIFEFENGDAQIAAMMSTPVLSFFSFVCC